MYYSHGNQEPISNVRERAAETRYNGLKNQGATCYLNSVLQCLYMTEDFRKQVENFVPNQINSDEESLVKELQKLFKGMKEHNCTTEGITRCLGITKVYEQEDVVEYYQKTLQTIGPQLSKVFKGKMSNRTRCVKGHIFKEECDFYTIPLAIKGGDREVFNVINGLNTFLEPIKLDEDNSLYCKDCRRKNTTETWNEIEELPTILTLYPKRFYFHPYLKRPVKNHCTMDIPLHFWINENKYELYAVINHMGTEYGGHYNAVIKSFEDDKWYCFNDSSVFLWDPPNFNDSSNSQNAYLLMYRMRYSQKEKSQFHHKQELSKTTFNDRHSSVNPKDAEDSFQNSKNWGEDVTNCGNRDHRPTSSGERGHRTSHSSEQEQGATFLGEQEHKATSMSDSGCSEREHRPSHLEEQRRTWSSSDKLGCEAVSSAECSPTQLNTMPSSIEPLQEGLQHGLASLTVQGGELNESVYNSCITQIMGLRRRLERYESQMLSCCCLPVKAEPLKAFAEETTEQMISQAVLEDIKKDLDKVVKQSEAALAVLQQSIWGQILHSHIYITMNFLYHVRLLFSVYKNEKLKTQ